MHRARSDSGLALPIVLTIGTILSFLAYGLSFFMVDIYKIRAKVDLRKKAEYSSKGSIECVLFGLRNKSSDDLSGIVDINGNNAGFTSQTREGRTLSSSSRYFDPSTGKFFASNDKKRRCKVTISEDGSTFDGLRKRYKIVAEQSY